MEEFFFIPQEQIEYGWDMVDPYAFDALEYCCEVLLIPAYIIKDAMVTDGGIELELWHLEDWMIGEDWYINLFRLSHYVLAS